MGAGGIVIGKAGQGMAGEEWERMGRGVAGEREVRLS
jgi:hypothetical protein